MGGENNVIKDNDVIKISSITYEKHQKKYLKYKEKYLELKKKLNM